MSIPVPDSPEIQVFDLDSSYNWFDSDGIFYSIAKKIERTPEIMKASAEAVKSIFNGNKYCVIVEPTNIRLLDRKTRLYVASELGKLYKAIAVVSPNPMGRMAGNIIYSLSKKEIPQKAFSSVEEAKAWLQQFQ